VASDIAMIAKALLPIMEALFQIMVPLMPHPPPDAIVFIKHVDTVIRTNLASTNITISESGKVYATALLMHSAYSTRKTLDLSALFQDISKLTLVLAGEETILTIEGLSLLLPLLKDRTMSMGGKFCV
jgi:hypothetical protein